MACKKSFKDIVTYEPVVIDGEKFIARHVSPICSEIGHDSGEDAGDIVVTLRTCGKTACENYTEVQNG